MTNLKNTKRALLFCMLSMLVCFAMLIGSTFAWFTDSVTSSNNKIVAGNLKVALQYSVDGENWNDVDENTNMFKEDGLWEPGYTEVVYLKVVNEGTLALKYQFGMNVVKEVKGTNVFGEKFKLSDFIQFGIVEVEEAFTDRQSAIDAVSSKATAVANGYSSDEGHLTKGNTSNMLALVVYMPESVDNNANYKKDTKTPEIYLGVTLVATQDTVEKDSFDENYDKTSKYPELEGGDENWYDENAELLEISTQDQLVEFAKLVNSGEDSFAGKTVTLANNIALDGVSNWTPIGTSTKPFEGTFDGDGYTVSKLMLNSEIDTDNIAFIGYANKAIIKNLTVEGTITIDRKVASTTTQHSDGTYVAGLCASANNGTEISRCVNKVNIDVINFVGGQLRVAGILGHSYKDITIQDCLNEGNITVNRQIDVPSIFVGGILSYEYRTIAKLENVVNVGTITEIDFDYLNIISCSIVGMVDYLTVKNWYSTTGNYLTIDPKLGEEGQLVENPLANKTATEEDFKELLEAENSNWKWDSVKGYPVLK